MLSRLQASFWNTKSSEDHCRAPRPILQRKAKKQHTVMYHTNRHQEHSTQQLNTSTKGQKEAHGQHRILLHVLIYSQGGRRGGQCSSFKKKRIESLGNILEIKWGWLKGEPWLNKQRHASAWQTSFAGDSRILEGMQRTDRWPESLRRTWVVFQKS